MTERHSYSPFPLINLALDHARLLIAVPLAAAIIAVGIGLLMGGKYAAESSFKPQSEQSELGRISGLAAQFGIDLGGGAGGGESVDFYARLARSRSLLEAVATRQYTLSSGEPAGTLVELYGVAGQGPDQLRRTVERLGRDITVQTDLNASVISIGTRHRDRAVAEQINRAILDEVNRFNLERRQSQASAERHFVEAEVARARQDLANAEAEMSAFMESNRRYDEWPQLRFEAGRLQRQVDLQQQVYTTLTQALERARLDEVRNTPVITIIDQPEGSARQRRGLAQKAALGALLGLTLVLAFVFVRDYTARLERQYPDEFARVRQRRPWLAALIVLVLSACEGQSLEPVPTPVSLASVTSGWDHTCGLASGGEVYCWGRGREGQLGDDSSANSAVPVLVRTGRRFQAISAGGTFTCGLDEGGGAWCWGSANGMAAGTRDGAAAMVPGDHRFTAISAGGNHACGLKADGSVWCWGDNASGQFGDGTTSSATAPVRALTDQTFSYVTAGGRHTCAMTTGSASPNVWCWGLNDVGQAGVGGYDMIVKVPTPVARDVRLINVSAGFDHNCAVAEDNALWCWGGNGRGQLANGAAGVPGAISPFASPAGWQFARVEAGVHMTCGVTTGNRGMCWGRGTSGQIGVGKLIDQYWPQFIHFLPTHMHSTDLLLFHAVSPGRDHVCGRTREDVAFCWGSGAQGQLGSPRLLESILPVRVPLMR